MECSSLLENAVKKGNIQKKIHLGSSEKDLIVDIQRVLFELGFRKELKIKKYGIDGIYGKATTAAVLAFAKKNGIQSDGKSITKKLAKIILQRHDFLPSMHVLWSIYKADLRKRYYISKGTRISIVAIQTLLNELGYGKQMRFTYFGADGNFGKYTKSAVVTFANNHNIKSGGDQLSRPLVNLLVKKVYKYYGRDWSDLSLNYKPQNNAPLVIYEGNRFLGKPCWVNKQFLPALKKINEYAERANVYVVVTSSFRTTTNVNGAIVKPAVFSNHLVGHGIDMNVRYNKNKLANSRVLIKYPNIPKPVKQFLKSIIDDPNLRWGGKFRHKDPVHIDDGLNQNMAKWKQSYYAVQQAVQLGRLV